MALAAASLASCASSTGASVTADGGRAVAFTPSAQDLADVATTFDTLEGDMSPCLAMVAPGTFKFATVTSTGEQWAYAQFVPRPGCFQYDGGPSATVAPDEIFPFNQYQGKVLSDRITFRKPARSAWQGSWDSGVPFPCPDPDGLVPGDRNGAFPKSVLDAWGLHYADGCAHVFFRLPPDH